MIMGKKSLIFSSSGNNSRVQSPDEDTVNQAPIPPAKPNKVTMDMSASNFRSKKKTSPPPPAAPIKEEESKVSTA